MKRFFRWMGIVCLFGLLSSCSLPVHSLQLGETDATVEPSELQASAEMNYETPFFSNAQPAVLWGRQQLSAHAQEAYDKMSQAIACHSEEPLTVDADTGEIQMILTALRIDHPEYYWFDGETSFVTTTLGGINLRTECTFTYTMDRDQIQTAQQQIQQYTDACLTSQALLEAQNDFDKILGVYRYIIENTDYIVTETDQSIVSVMGRHQATCAGYARTFQYLMSELGIPCTLALGEGASGEPHGWNMVQCEGSWYQMDVTWGDPVSTADASSDSIQYTYCLVTDQEIYRDHTLVSEIPMPECTDTAYNYFIQVGRQFSDWDPEAYETAMNQAVALGEVWFSVRFLDQSAYEAATQALFEQGEIWNLLTRCGATTDAQDRVTYTQNDLFYEISVKLDQNETEGRNET